MHTTNVFFVISDVAQQKVSQLPSEKDIKECDCVLAKSLLDKFIELARLLDLPQARNLTNSLSERRLERNSDPASTYKIGTIF
jgi:hypothetical protein